MQTRRHVLGDLCLCLYGTPTCTCQLRLGALKTLNMALSVRVMKYSGAPHPVKSQICHAGAIQYANARIQHCDAQIYCIDRAPRKGCQGGGDATHKPPRT